MSEDPIHFPATPPYSKWPAVNDVFDCIRNGNWEIAKAVFAAHRQDITDAIGNINAARTAFNGGLPVQPSVALAPPLAPFETRTIAGGQPGTVYAVQADASGGFSVEISGSPWITYSVGAQGVFDPARTLAGSGTGTPLTVAKDEWCNWKYDAVSGGQTMRPQLL